MLPARAMLIKPSAGGGGGGATDPLLSLNKLLLGFEGTNGSTTFTDESASPVTFSVGSGSPVISTSSPLVGTASLSVPAGAAISTASGTVKWDPAALNFCAEMVFQHTSAPGASNTTYFTWGSNPTCRLYRLSDGSMQVYLRTVAQGFIGATGSAGGWNPSTNLTYVCVERNGGTLRGYAGTTTATGGGTATMLAKSTGLSGALEAANAALLIGGSDGFIAGKVDEFRMKIGSGAELYATDTTYTIPTLPFPRT